MSGAIKADIEGGVQVELPTKHYIANGVYIREVFMPAGTWVVGHQHKTSSWSNMIMGKLMLSAPDGPLIVTAPHTFVSPPGRKIAYILEDTVFQNIYATDETDVAKIESSVIDKSAAWSGDQKIRDIEEAMKRIEA